MLNIIRRQFLFNRGFLISTSLVLCVFQFLLCAIVASINLPAALNQFLAFAPPIVRTMMEQSIGGGSSAGILAFAWNHPVTHALITAVAITFGARAVAGEIENGAVELVLTLPLSRRSYLGAHVLFAMISMMMVDLAGLAGTIGGQEVFDLQLFRWDRLLRLFVNVFLLQMSLYGVTLLFSSFGRETGRVATLGVLVAILSFLTNAIATLWTKAAFLKPYSLHSYYDPRPLLVDGHLATSSVVVLGAFTCVVISIAFARFLTRDVP